MPTPHSPTVKPDRRQADHLIDTRQHRTGMRVGRSTPLTLVSNPFQLLLGVQSESLHLSICSLRIGPNISHICQPIRNHPNLGVSSLFDPYTVYLAMKSRKKKCRNQLMIRPEKSMIHERASKNG